MVTKRPKVHGSEKLGVICSKVKWSKVMILCEMRALSFIYTYVDVCRFCAVGCFIIICLYLLFSNYAT